MFKLVSFVALLALSNRCSGQRLNFAGLVNGATCIASSSSFGAECWRALDSRETYGVDEWISFREGGGWININFAQPGLINEVRFLQRCPAEDQSKDIEVAFPDGHRESITLSCSDSTTDSDCEDVQWERLAFVPRFAQSVNVSIVSTCSDGGFTGFREITAHGSVMTEVEDDANLVLSTLGGTCESSSNEDDSHTCDFAIDGVVGAAPNQSWASASGNIVGSWLELSLPGLSQVSKLRFKTLCVGEQQIKRVRVDFDEGSSQEVEFACNPDDFPEPCDELPWNEQTLPNIRTTGVTITTLEACWSNVTNVGYQEVEILGIAEGDQSCPFDFDQQPFLSSCYKFISAPEDRVSLEQARDVCSGLHPNAHLVEINNMAEQDYLARTAETQRLSGTSCSVYYTDGHFDGGVWKWFASGNQIILPFWYGGSPPIVVTNGKPTAEKRNDKSDMGVVNEKENEQVTAATALPWAGDYIAASYVPGAGPYEQWNWVGSDGQSPGCFVCEIYTGL